VPDISGLKALSNILGKGTDGCTCQAGILCPRFVLSQALTLLPDCLMAVAQYYGTVQLLVAISFLNFKKVLCKSLQKEAFRGG